MDVETTLYICLEVLIALLSVVGNTLVCYVVMQSRTLRKKVMYVFVTSLAVADICVGLFAIPFSILTKLGLPHSSPHICIAMLSFIMVPTQISIFNMMAIAIERYMAIRHARIHYTKLTLNRSLYVIVITWTLSVIMGMLPLLGWNNINSKIKPLTNGTTTVHGWTTNATFDKDQATGIEETEFCQFMRVMDFDYMFFNFVVCVLPPLITSAVLYSIIFFSFLQATKTKFTSEVRSPVYATGTNGKEIAIDSTPASSPPFRNGTYSGTVYTSNLVEMKQISKFSESAHDKLQLNNGTNLPQENRVCQNRARSHMDEKNNVKEPICLANIRVEVESPSSSVHTIQTYDVGRNGSNTTLQTSKRSLSIDTNTEVDTRLLRVKLEKLEKQIDSGNVEAREPVESGNAQTSGYNSANSSASSPQMRSRSGTDFSERTRRRHRERRQKKRKREFKAAAVLCLIVLCFAICWMPIHMLNTIHRFDLEGTIQVPAALYSVAILLSHANSCINFFLYSWRLRAFREQLKMLVLNRCFARRPM